MTDNQNPARQTNMKGDGEASIIECLAAGEPFVFDPATNFLHADDGSVEGGIRYVPAPQEQPVGYGLFDETGRMIAWTDEKGFAQAKWNPERVRPLFAGHPPQEHVKPLEWVQMNDGCTFHAQSILGRWARWEGHYLPPEGYGGIRCDDPIAAAQADYESRILSALITTAPQTNMQPAAYTSQHNLDRLREQPGRNSVMWGEPLPHHEDVPLYLHPPAPQEHVVGYTIDQLKEAYIAGYAQGNSLSGTLEGYEEWEEYLSCILSEVPQSGERMDDRAAEADFQSHVSQLKQAREWE